MSKPNLRSFRYSNEVARILENEPGSGLNEKFENLVLTCHNTLPDVMDRKGVLEAEIRELRNKRDALRRQIYSLDDVAQFKIKLFASFGSYCDSMKDLQEKAAQLLEGPLL